MRNKTLIRAIFLSLLWLAPAPAREALKMPYQASGLTQHDAALHLLNRFAFGPRPGEAEQVVKMGLENWSLTLS